MSADPGEPSEEELRAAYEAELSRITSADMMLQAAVSLLNIGGRRLGSSSGAQRSEIGPSAGSERDLEQVRDAIDGVRALLGILERRLPQELRPLRDALSQLQMAYAREARAVEESSAAQQKPETNDATGSEQAQTPTSEKASPTSKPGESSDPGPAESSGRLWVPGR